MTSMILSENSLKRLHKHGFADGTYQTTVIPRPKTALPGKRRPSTESSREGVNTAILKSNEFATFRPKTSYGRRQGSITDIEHLLDQDKRNLSSKEKENPSYHERRKPLSVKREKSPPHRDRWNTVSIEKAIADIDIVEYFNDKSVRDIFPVYTNDDRKINTPVKSQNDNGNIDKILTKPKPIYNQNAANVNLEDSRLQKRLVLKRLNHRKFEIHQNLPDTNIESTFEGSKYTSTSPKFEHNTCRNNLSITPLKRESERKDLQYSVLKNSSHNMKSRLFKNPNPSLREGLLANRSLASHHKVPSYIPQRIDNYQRSLNRYTNDFRTMEADKQLHGSYYRMTALDRPVSLHTTKFPKKLKPIVSTNNKIRCKSEVKPPTKH